MQFSPHNQSVRLSLKNRQQQQVSSPYTMLQSFVEQTACLNHIASDYLRKSLRLTTMAPLFNLVTDNDYEVTHRSITNAFRPPHIYNGKNYLAMHQILQIVCSHFRKFFSQLALHSLYYELHSRRTRRGYQTAGDQPRYQIIPYREMHLHHTE